MTTIQEALHELFNPAAVADAPVRRKSRAFDDLFDQVYCSLTDGGANSAYSALGPLNGQYLYDRDELELVYEAPRPGMTTLTVRCPVLTPALYIAGLYGLETKLRGSQAVSIFIPNDADVDNSLLHKSNIKIPGLDELKAYRAEQRAVEQSARRSTPISDNLTSTSIDEDFNSSMPATPLSHDVVYNFIENVPVATSTQPPVFFPVGYMKELNREIPSKFRGGRGSEGNPFVRIVKCSEMTVYTGAPYENLQATKDMRRDTGKERSGERTGFSFNGDTGLENKIGISASGEEQLQCYIKRGTRSKAKYWISLDGEDLREATRQEVAQYLTPAHANAILGGRGEGDSAESGAKVMRLKLSNIYRIGRNGTSVM